MAYAPITIKGLGKLGANKLKIIEGLPGVLGNKGTWPFNFRGQEIS